MPNQINLLPEVLDLLLYAGDGVKFRMVCTTEAGSPIDIRGSVSAQIRKERLDPDPPLASFGINMTEAYLGIVVISLTGEQTAELASNNGGKFSGVWDIQWSPSDAEPRTLCQGKVECSADVTR